MNRILLLLILILLFLLTNSCRTVKVEKMFADRIIQKPIQIENIDSTLLDKFERYKIIKVPEYYGGLNPQYPLAIVSIDSALENCVRKINRFNTLSIDLLVYKDSNFTLIESDSALFEMFLPIDSWEEALSLASILTGYVPMYDFDIKFRYRRYVKTIYPTYVSYDKKYGYYVHLFDFGLHGCGPHFYTMIIILLREDGSWEIYSEQVLLSDPRLDHYCID